MLGCLLGQRSGTVRTGSSRLLEQGRRSQRATQTAPALSGRSVRRGRAERASRRAITPSAAPSCTELPRVARGHHRRLNGGAGSTSSTVSHVGPPGWDGLRLFNEQGDRVVALTRAAARRLRTIAGVGFDPLRPAPMWSPSTSWLAVDGRGACRGRERPDRRYRCRTDAGADRAPADACILSLATVSCGGSNTLACAAMRVCTAVAGFRQAGA